VGAQVSEDGLLNLTQYARHRGVALKAVQDALSSGRITAVMKGHRRFIDPEKADAEWEQNTNHNMRFNTRDKPFANYEQEAERHVNSKVPPFQESRAIREAYQSRITKLEYEQKKGLLIEREKVKTMSMRTAAIIKNNLQQIPTKIAAEIAAMTDTHDIEMRLAKEIDDALSELSRYEERFN
jgi:hypothetical protein